MDGYQGFSLQDILDPNRTQGFSLGLPQPNYYPPQQQGGSNQLARYVLPTAQSSPYYSQTEAILKDLAAGRAGRGGGILGPALLQGIAGFAGRAPGPGWGAVSGLASGMAGQMDKQYERRRQAEMDALAANEQLQKMWVGQNVPTTGMIKDPLNRGFDIPGIQHVGEAFPQPFTGYGQTGEDQPPAQGGQANPYNLPTYPGMGQIGANPDLTKSAQNEFNQNTSAYRAHADIYNRARNVYEASQRHPTRVNDMSLLAAYFNMQQPGSVSLRSGNVVANADPATDLYQKVEAMKNDLLDKDTGLFAQQQSRDEIMYAINQAFQPLQDQAFEMQKTARQTYGPYGVRDNVFDFTPARIVDVSPELLSGKEGAISDENAAKAQAEAQQKAATLPAPQDRKPGETSVLAPDGNTYVWSKSGWVPKP